jgi:hypothetical protein
MRTTLDLPDTLFRRTKALAAMRGSSMKDLIVGVLEREVDSEIPEPERPARRPFELPAVHLAKGRTLDLSEFDFDDLLT